MGNNAKLSVTTFIDKCANVLLGVAGSASLGLLCGHAYRKVVPSEKGFDATAAALFGGTLYLIDTVGKKVFDPVFKNFANSTKTGASGIRLALEAGLAYKLTEIVAKQLEAPFEMTPYDTQFFGTCAAVGVVGMAWYAKVSEKMQEKGIFATTTDGIIDRAVQSLQREVKKSQPFSLEEMDPKGIDALAACPKEHYHISVNEEGELEVKKGSVAEVFGSTPYYGEEFREKFDLIDPLYDSFINFFEKEELGIGKSNRAGLEKIKEIILDQLEQVKSSTEPSFYSFFSFLVGGRDHELRARLSARADKRQRAINAIFEQVEAASELKKNLLELGWEGTNDQLMSLLKSYWAFAMMEKTCDELEEDIGKFIGEDRHKDSSRYLDWLLDGLRKNFHKRGQWEATVIPPQNPQVSVACMECRILLKRLNKYFPCAWRRKGILKFAGTNEDLIQICHKLMEYCKIIKDGLVKELKGYSPENRAKLFGQQPGLSNKAGSSLYFFHAFLFLTGTYRKIVNLDKNVQNPNVDVLGPNWKEQFFEEGTRQNEWRIRYHKACDDIRNVLGGEWPEEKFRLLAAKHKEGEEFPRMPATRSS